MPDVAARAPVTGVLVVVPAHDEEERIGACLSSVSRAADELRRRRPGTTVDLTVVLDRCSDATAAVAGRVPGVRLIAVDAGCVGAARAAGVAAAAGRLGHGDPAGVLVVNTDADCVVPPLWLVEHVTLAASADVVLGAVRPDALEMTPPALAHWWARHPVGRESLHGANLGVRLDAYLAAGGFPAVADREDALLVLALRAWGAAVVGGTRVTTSARREGRVPAGFAGYLRAMDIASAGTARATRPVRLGAGAALHADSLVQEAADVADAGPSEWLGFADDWGRRLPRPGLGATLTRWEMLASAGAVDLSVARALEPHADALAILAEADLSAPPAGSTWGVYAAEGPGTRLTASEQDGRWLLDGTKPWCSLAAEVSHALVTAWVGDDGRGLFAVPLRRDDVHVEPVTWASRGLAAITSGPVTLTSAPAEPVGGPGWYLRRDGFAWGGIGVAAIWYGAAVALARRLRLASVQREPDQVGRAHLGAVDVALAGARSVLAQAATAVDAGRAGGPDGEVLALRVRAVVADAVERVLTHVDHALGPGPLTQEEEHARRVADLRVYVRQQHAERDDAVLGGRLAASPDEPW